MKEKALLSASDASVSLKKQVEGKLLIQCREFCFKTIVYEHTRKGKDISELLTENVKIKEECLTVSRITSFDVNSTNSGLAHLNHQHVSQQCDVSKPEVPCMGSEAGSFPNTHFCKRECCAYMSCHSNQFFPEAAKTCAPMLLGQISVWLVYSFPNCPFSSY